MSNWRNTAITLPGWVENTDLPTDLNDLKGFEHHAKDVALDIEVGGSVELQRIDPDGLWETFETATGAADIVIVANRSTIRFNPVDACTFRVCWNQ
ncbi:hypothetical protein R3X27_16780 [Tropicimonas sp. TH_r6]|uniref:hypothetical protein n=1 Tax=Tropicimonas sp. TH_r6 TaxID=3082085 RepID=UPI002953AC9C|nr:hypothetical protein [Tropicimonas sp. TH_r6]MDV7144338.1 hypothetical protein [Tropicimonas sp. TH_r6]